MARYTISLVNLRHDDQLDYHVMARDTRDAAQELFDTLRHPFEQEEPHPGERAILLHECIGPRVRLLDQFQTSDTAMEVLNKFYYA